MDNKMETDLQVLLANLKKACSLWFLNEQTASDRGSNYTSKYDNIIVTTVEILRHRLCLKQEDAATLNNFASVDFSEESLALTSADRFKKMVDEFDWVCRSAQIRDSFAADISTKLASSPQNVRQSTPPQLVDGNIQHAIEYFLRSWVERNLKANCLTACLQVLVAEKELLNTYYKENAYLQREEYSTALFICLSAIELNQFSLLSQIETSLYSPTTAGALIANYPSARSKHRRTSSHPLFSFSPAKSSNKEEIVNDVETNKMSVVIQKSSTAKLRVPILSTFRKTKSLPELQYKPSVSFDLFFDEKPRRRTKTMLSKSNISPRQDITKYKRTSPTAIPFVAINSTNVSNECYNNSNTNTTTTSGSSYSGSEIADLSLLPATSSKSLQQHLNAENPTLNPTATSTSSIASSSISSETTACRIDLINCDDIKIWTDQAYDQDTPTTAPCNIPQNLDPQKFKTKSCSPIGSFLCNLFSTPPTYTHWSIANQSDSCYGANLIANDQNATAVVAASTFPCNLAQHNEHSSGGGVFDSFLPVYGKKLRSRNSQSLFEDGISTLDYKTPAINESRTSLALEVGGAKCKETTPKTLPKKQQSLTDFLQMSQMSRNNTELEKENAHFLVSEAIISAIEHIKWDNSTDPEKKWRRRKAPVPTGKVTTATDCLATDDAQTSKCKPKLETQPSHDESSEHIPYAELDESCLDLLSAEVVGLSIISKFDEKHLPKVSELKWLVSEDDTPQQLLPMPDCSPTANPDENVIRPLTRGTRYWAPPRQQIIFTDHPIASRKELIQKQNNRCTGCGMRVSRQYMKSFRYCTYLGKYHCTGCHRNQISPIPAKILQAWDFKCYPVSVFSYRLLEQMYTYPLFYVPDLNPALYIENKALLSARKKRVHLKFVKDFVKTCRFAIREQVYFESIPEHITNDPDIWSLSDFIDVHNKSMQRSIDQLIENCEHHIFNCVLCTARGFHCEFCQKDQVIYPWQQKVFRCDRCGSCFHMNCWKLLSDTCCRCQRISKRQEIAAVT